jgi:RimJ/RimL family protein N-acetyltransferase
VPELVELHMRCTAETRTRRYHSAMAVPPRAQLARLINPRRGICLGAEDPDGRIVAFGNLAWPTGFQQVAELGLLVQDDLQGRGMGSELAKRLLIGAIDAELPEVEAYVQPDNLPMLRLLAGLGMPTRRERRDGMLAVSVELPALASQH